MPDLSGKVALVTGSARGIGKAIALELAKGGADLVISDLQEDWCSDAVAEMEATGRRAIGVGCDVANPESCEALVARALEVFGRLDILVNNAGITKDNLIMRMKPEEWEAVINVNLGGVFYCTKAVVRTMIKQRGGAIINLASVVGLMGNTGQANYSASKGGVIALTKTTAKELGGKGIRVNAVAPGFIQTAMTDKLPEEARRKFLDNIPLGRAGTPEDVAQVVAFLASDEASYLTGQVLCIDGGLLM